MNDYPATPIHTKYGTLEVTFQGNREFKNAYGHERHESTLQGANVQTAEGKPLTVNGIEYMVRAWVVYGEHWSRDAVVTDWHYAPGEYASAHRKNGQFGFTAEPTDKARGLIRDLCLEAATVAQNTTEHAFELAESVRLDKLAERTENEAQEAAANAKRLANEAHLLRDRAQTIRWRLDQSKATA